MKNLLFETAKYHILLSIMIFFTSCASVNMKQASPAEWGWGVQASPGIQIKDGPFSAHALVAYSRLSFDGGHDNVYQFGGQVRRTLDESSPDGWWVGGELSYLRFKSVFDEETFFEDDPTANGYTIGALAGYRVPVRDIPVSPYLGVSLVGFGDFKSQGQVIDASGTGIFLKVGLCVHVASLLYEKGR